MNGGVKKCRWKLAETGSLLHYIHLSYLKIANLALQTTAL